MMPFEISASGYSAANVQRKPEARSQKAEWNSSESGMTCNITPNLASIYYMVATRICFMVAVFCGICYPAGPALRTRKFAFEYKAVIKDLPTGTKHVDLWLPVPHDDPYQQIKDLRIESPYSYKIVVGADGNTMLHVAVENPKEPEVAVTLSLDAARQEHLQARLYRRDKSVKDEDEKDLAQWLKPDRLVPIDDQIRTWAREVVEAAHAHTDLE